jgi:hypothetical protein
LLVELGPDGLAVFGGCGVWLVWGGGHSSRVWHKNPWVRCANLVADWGVGALVIQVVIRIALAVGLLVLLNLAIFATNVGAPNFEQIAKPFTVISATPKPQAVIWQGQKPLMQIMKTGDATSWGFYKPTNQAGLISFEIDSLNSRDTTIDKTSCFYVVDGKYVDCATNSLTDLETLVQGGGWSNTVQFVIDLTDQVNIKPHDIVVGFETVNSKGRHPVELAFTIEDWR